VWCAAGEVSEPTVSEGDQTGIARSVGGSAGHALGTGGSGLAEGDRPQAGIAGSVGGSAGQTSLLERAGGVVGVGHAGVIGSMGSASA